jgi:cell division protein FtsB
MGRLVQPPVEAEKTLESMREESERLTKEVNKLRDELKDLFDR